VYRDRDRCENKYGKGNCEIRGVTGSRIALPYCRTEAEYLKKQDADLYVEDGLGTMGSRCHILAKTIGSISDYGTCPPAEDSSKKYTTKTGALCYVNCEREYGQGWYNNGTSCFRDVSTLLMDSMSCKEGEFKSGARCYKKCKEVHGNDYSHDGTRCFRAVSTLGPDTMTCKSNERYIGGRCYPKLFNNDFTDLNILGQTREKKPKGSGFFDVSNQVKQFRQTLSKTY
jgi:hypothetical protein